jgi:hypothetical protein
MNETASDFHWYTPFAIIAVVVSLLVVGPIALVPAWFVRRFAARAPVWDPDRYWDAVRGCAVVGSAIYAVLAMRVLLFIGTHLDLSGPPRTAGSDDCLRLLRASAARSLVGRLAADGGVRVGVGAVRSTHGSLSHPNVD